jgi:hypothetical protein
MRASVSPRLTRYTSGGAFLSGEASLAAGAGVFADADGPAVPARLVAPVADALSPCAPCCPTFAQPVIASASDAPAMPTIIALSKRFPIMFES